MRVLPLVFLLGCSAPAAEVVPDAAPDAGLGQTDGKDLHCASTFGDGLTDDFGRVDGTVVAVVEPGNERCAMPNGDHVIVQVEVDGEVYRMVVNVQSDFGDPRIRILGLGGIALPAPAFAEGWHPGLSLDYATDLDIHSDDAFAPYELADAVTRVADTIEIGDPISVYATSSGGTYAHSAHLIHRNGNGIDGAVIVDPESAGATWLLFRFEDQRF